MRETLFNPLIESLQKNAGLTLRTVYHFYSSPSTV
jgi:hypothetical protein